ncbi:HlyD family secretion protein [Fontimonas thermophila]|uniref:HlyD family secretion protein n=1 Tax=Fontimonas thermophila TaxID=1076937 RepID=A0A1I2I4M0_9GAMM|nr:efflux RND transporter periplasmic adaptor subunit [Fontimonas thermophila]SFF37399.1 HlyD family secretion protein [Fontimonas thermophila]
MTPVPPSDGSTTVSIDRIAVRGHGRRRWRTAVLVVIALAAAAAIAMLLARDGASNAPQWITHPVERGTLVVKVSATGRLQPTHQVAVGSELSGTVAAVFVDDDDHVTKGQILAQLDLSKFEDAVTQARAALAAAQAGLEQARATLAETETRLNRYREVARLSGGKVPAKAELDTAEAEHARARANVASARAAVAQAQATLRTSQTNLAKARIRSPIDGVVLQRAVDPGQAVAASLQAVTLFTIAEDLSKMELKVDIDEADVGQVKAGMEASFTVDAWPGRRFHARILRVGFNATDNGGVISYPAVLQVANDDLSLRPGMTGTADIITLTRDNVLLVPNAALRFNPPAADSQPQRRQNLLSVLMPRPPRQPRAVKTTASTDDGAPKQVWVLREGRPVALSVQTGATNGRVTEITGGELEAGMQVITEVSVNR